MNVTLASLILSSITQRSPLFSLPLHYEQSRSTLSINSCHFSHFIPNFMNIISQNIQTIDKIYGISHNQHFSIDSSTFSHFLGPAVIVQSIPEGSADCNRLRSFTINQTTVLNKSDSCGLVRRTNFNHFYCTPSVFFVNASNYKLFVDHDNFTYCTLCIYIYNGTVDVESSFFKNCTASTEEVNNSITLMDYGDQELYQKASVALLYESAFNNFTRCEITNALPAPFYLTFASCTFSHVLSQYIHAQPSADTFLVSVVKCAMVRFENTYFTLNAKETNAQGTGGIYIEDCQNVDLFYVFFHNFTSYSLQLKDCSYVTMDYVCFQKPENQEIELDESSSYLVLHPKHVVFNPDCQFTPTATTKLTKADRNYGIIALVVFTVFFFCVFVAFIICIFKKKKPAEEAFPPLNNEDFSTEETSRSISD